MIQTWKDPLAKSVFLGEQPKGFPPDLLKRARRKLQALDAAMDVTDLRFPPGNRLHSLKDDRAGQWSISVNDQFRICFTWPAEGPSEVEFVDYH